jgi:hypothetical protein
LKGEEINKELELQIIENFQILKKNKINSLKIWRELTEEQKNQDGYPSGLISVLEKAACK